MISIRYRNELSPGLHAAAEQHGRTTTVYLLSGLTVAQRRAALRRLRISARRGYGPRLPARPLALALAVDRIRTTLGRVGAVFRSHPAGSTVPVMFVSAGAIAFLALSAVSIQVIHQPLRPPGSAHAVAGPDASVSAGPGIWHRPAARQPGPAGPGAPPASQPGSSSSPAGRPTSGSNPSKPSNPSNPSNPGDPGDPSSPAAGPTGSGLGTTLSGGAVPTSTAAAAPTAAPQASATPSSSAPSSTPSPTPTAGKTRTCLKLGPLRACVSLP
jgi:hypothetical protein